jgi:hypothetical protein
MTASDDEATAYGLGYAAGRRRGAEGVAVAVADLLDGVYRSVGDVDERARLRLIRAGVDIAFEQVSR